MDAERCAEDGRMEEKEEEEVPRLSYLNREPNSGDVGKHLSHDVATQRRHRSDGHVGPAI